MSDIQNMTKDSLTKKEKQEAEATIRSKEKKSLLQSVLLVLRISVLVGFAVASYVIFQDLYSKEEARIKAEERAIRAQEQLQQINNQKRIAVIASSDTQQIYDSIAKKNENYGFLYQELMKEKTNIEELKSHFHYLDNELLKIKHSKNLGKILLSYISLREQIFYNGNDGIAPYVNELQNFEILIGISNPDLNNKINALKLLLPNLKSQRELSQEFDDLIPELLVAKKVGMKDDLASKIRYNLSKMVVIRRLDGTDSPEQIDGIIARTERLIAKQNYRGALNRIRSLDPVYGAILVDFVQSLEVALRVQKIDNEILSYLKNIS